MEGKILSCTRRARFIDDTHLENSSVDNDSRIDEKSTSPQIFPVLHNAVPDLRYRTTDSGVRIAESLPTLASLTAEFNDLSRKMTMLKETIKATGGSGSSKKSGSMEINSSSQALQVGNITGIAMAKLVVHDCIAELISINHFLDGNEEIATVYREKLQHAIAHEYGKTGNIIIQEVSLAPNNYNWIPCVGNTATDSAIGATDHFFNRNIRKEVEIQTEARKADLIEASTVKSVTQSPDAYASLKLIGETNQQSKRAARRKARKW